MPKATGSVPQSLYGVRSVPIGSNIAIILSWVLILVVLPILIIVGIVTFKKIKDKEREKNTNPNNKTPEQENIIGLKKKLFKIIIWIIVITVVLFMAIGIIPFLINRRALKREIAQMHMQNNYNNNYTTQNNYNNYNNNNKNF